VGNLNNRIINNRRYHNNERDWRKGKTKCQKKRYKQRRKGDEKEANKMRKITTRLPVSGMRRIERWFTNVSAYIETSIFRVSVVG
jgi:hypothetical protein